MLDFRSEVRRRILFAITFFGFVECHNRCSPPLSNVYLSDGDCIYMCDAQNMQRGYFLCENDHRTAISCLSAQPATHKTEEAECVTVQCNALKTTQCSQLPSQTWKEVYFIRTGTLRPKENETLFPTYIRTEKPTLPNTRWSNGDYPRITAEEPGSQIYIYGILSFFFGVIAFFAFALVFRFLYKRYHHQPVHIHTFSGHQLPRGLQLRSFLSPSAPVATFPHIDQTGQGIPGLDLPPSYVVASELLDPPPSYEDVSKPKGHSAQQKVTSL